ncbi:MAG: hypothetical protein WKF82_13290 [Nocardioidaceae bacterium]
MSAVVALIAASFSPASAMIASDPVLRTSWGTNGRVLAIVAAPAGDRVYVAGDFTAVTDLNGGTYPVNNLAVYLTDSGTFDPNWDPNANAPIRALALSGDQLYLGGDFTQVGGEPRTRLAAVDANTGNPKASWKTKAIGGPVRTLAVSNGEVYVGGNFTTLKDSTGSHAQSRLGRLDSGTGAFDATWTPTPDAQVYSVVASADGSRVYVGGDFSSISNASNTNRIASLSTTNGTPTPGFNAGATNGSDESPVRDLHLDGSNLLAAVAGSGGGCASLNAGNGTKQWNKHTNGNLQAVTVIDGTAYCGGHFNGVGSFDGQTRYKLAAVDVSTGAVLDFAPRINSALGVWSLGSDSSHLYLGGDFTQVRGKPQSHFAEFS